MCVWFSCSSHIKNTCTIVSLLYATKPSQIIEAVEIAFAYTYQEGSPSKADFENVHFHIRKAAEECRTVFKHPNEKDVQLGYSPIAELAFISSEIRGLGFGDAFKPERVDQARDNILKYWITMGDILRDFDRTIPIWRGLIKSERSQIPLEEKASDATPPNNGIQRSA